MNQCNETKHLGRKARLLQTSLRQYKTSELVAATQCTSKALIVLVLLLSNRSVNANWKFNSFNRLVHPLVKPPFVAQNPLWKAKFSDAVANHMMGSFRQTFLTRNGIDIGTNMVCEGCYNRALVMAASLIRQNKILDDSTSKYNVKGYTQVWTADVPFVSESTSFRWLYHVVPVMEYGGEIYVVETLTGHESGFLNIRDWAAKLRPESSHEKYLFKLVGLDDDPSLDGRRRTTYQHTLDTLIDEIKAKSPYPENYLSSPKGNTMVELVDWASAELYYESRRPPDMPDYYDALEEQPGLHKLIHDRIAENHPAWSWTQRGWESSCRGG